MRSTDDFSSIPLSLSRSLSLSLSLLIEGMRLRSKATFHSALRRAFAAERRDAPNAGRNFNRERYTLDLARACSPRRPSGLLAIVRGDKPLRSAPRVPARARAGPPDYGTRLLRCRKVATPDRFTASQTPRESFFHPLPPRPRARVKITTVLFRQSCV